jgi:AraC-like DNA-binding protein
LKSFAPEKIVHKVQSAIPSAELRPYVRAYAQRNAEIKDTPLISRVPARLEQILEFQFAESFDVCFDNGYCLTAPRIGLIGPQTKFRASVRFVGKIISFGVFFQPAGFSQVFDVPMPLLVNAGVDGVSLLGHRIQTVWDQLSECNSFTERVSIIEPFLLSSLSIAKFRDRMAETSNRLLALQGRISVSELARETGMGVRQLERRFLERVGVAPKLHARIARFQTAVDMKVASPLMTWLEISHALGYFDQMHMIHDFKKLGGDSPNRVLEHLGDMRPDALASSFVNDAEASRVFTMRRSRQGLILPLA